MLYNQWLKEQEEMDYRTWMMMRPHLTKESQNLGPVLFPSLRARFGDREVQSASDLAAVLGSPLPNIFEWEPE